MVALSFSLFKYRDRRPHHCTARGHGQVWHSAMSSGQQSTTWSSKVPAASCPCHLGSCNTPPYLECSGQRCVRQWSREQAGASIIHLLSSHITQVSTHISTYLPACHSITLHPHLKHQNSLNIFIIYLFVPRIE